MIAKGRKAERAVPPVGKEISAVKRQLPPVPPPPDLRSIAISGSFSDMLHVVSRTAADLHLVTGRVDGEDSDAHKKVLVPFAEFRIGGASVKDVQDVDEDANPGTLFSATVSLENMAFMILDLMTDLRRICGEVSSIADGDLTPDADRMAHVRYYVATLERQARSCRIRLDKVYGEPQVHKED